MDTQYYVTILLIFLAVVLLMEGIYLFWNTYRGPEVRRIENRLRQMTSGIPTSEEGSLIKERKLSDISLVHELLGKIPQLHQLDQVLLQAGMSLKLSSFLTISVVGSVVAFLLSKILGLITPLALLLAVAALLAPLFVAFRRRQARLELFEQQLPEALDLITRALRAGHSMPHAIRMIGEEMKDPIRRQFQIVFDEVNYGFSMQEALLNLASRVPSADLRFFVLAATIQRETGGNLPELLVNISSLVRSRLNLLGKIRVLATEGVMSAWILGLLPLVIAVLLNIVNPGYMAMLWSDETGVKMVIGGLIWMGFGVLWIRKIIKIRV